MELQQHQPYTAALLVKLAHSLVPPPLLHQPVRVTTGTHCPSASCRIMYSYTPLQINGDGVWGNGQTTQAPAGVPNNFTISEGPPYSHW